jgi:hypothetical protein
MCDIITIGLYFYQFYFIYSETRLVLFNPNNLSTVSTIMNSVFTIIDTKWYARTTAKKILL